MLVVELILLNWHQEGFKLTNCYFNKFICKQNFSLNKCMSKMGWAELTKKRVFSSSQWLIAQLVERSLSVMKDPSSNLGMDICSFCYWSVIKLIVELMSINGRSIYIDCWLMLEPIGWMTKTLNLTMYAERDHLKIVKYVLYL